MATLFIGLNKPPIELEPSDFNSPDSIAKAILNKGSNISGPEMNFCFTRYEYCAAFIGKPTKVIVGNFTGLTSDTVDDIFCCYAHGIFIGMDEDMKAAEIIKIPMLMSLLSHERGHKDCVIYL